MREGERERERESERVRVRERDNILSRPPISGYAEATRSQHSCLSQC